MAVVATLTGHDVPPIDYDAIPSCIFSQPNIGTVGLSENKARATGSRIAVYRAVFTPLVHRLSGDDERTLVKLVVDRDSNRVLGAHLVGDVAGEIMQGLAIALQAGASKADFDRTLGIHPTTAEEFVSLQNPTA